MLQELINLIRNGGTLEPATLASRLDTTPEMIRAMLEHLERNGMLRKLETCNDHCSGCPAASLCGGKSKALRVWSLTE